VVRQFLCERGSESESVTVAAEPEGVRPPVTVPPVFDCSAVITGDELSIGATVEVWSANLGPLTARVRAQARRQTFAVNPALVAGDKVFLRQYPCSGKEFVNGEAVDVLPIGELSQTETIARSGDAYVTVNNGTPGARINVVVSGKWLGGGFVTESVGQMILLRQPLELEVDRVVVLQSLCDRQTNEEPPVLRPCPEAPVLLNPVEGDTWAPFDTPELSWSDPGSSTEGAADSYAVMVFEEGIGAAVFSDTTNGERLRIPSLVPCQDYRWIVVPGNRDCRMSPRTAMGTFRTRPDFITFELLALQFITPENELEVVGESVWRIRRSDGTEDLVRISRFTRLSMPVERHVRAPVSAAAQSWQIRLELILTGRVIFRRPDGIELPHLVISAPVESAWRRFRFPPEDGKTLRFTSRLSFMDGRFSLTNPI
jgi:hypothetical protein